MYVQVDKRSENITMDAKSAALRIEKNGRKNKKEKYELQYKSRKALKN